MRIPEELLKESNYEGTRLIEINDPKVEELKAKLKDIQVNEANPILDGALPYLKVIDPVNAKIGRLKARIQPLVEKMRPLKEQFETEVARIGGDLKEFTPELQAIKEKIDPYIEKIQKIEEDVLKCREEKKAEQTAYDNEMKKVELLDQKARLIKNKLVPLINLIVNPQLGEFEKATSIIEKDGKIYAEVIDQIEERVKQIREEKLKNASPR